MGEICKIAGINGTTNTLKQIMENNMQGYGWYFLIVGALGIGLAFAKAKNEREVFLILATIPAAFLTVRAAEFWRKRNKK